MASNSTKPGASRPVVTTFSAAVLAAAIAPMAGAAVNPFIAAPLASGYGHVNMQKAGDAGTPAEGSWGDGEKARCEGKCGEGKCGDAKTRQCEGKCGEGKCGADGAADSRKSASEGKCGEGMCGSH